VSQWSQPIGPHSLFRRLRGNVQTAAVANHLIHGNCIDLLQHAPHGPFTRWLLALPSQQLVCVSGRSPYLGPPKTKTSMRTVELPAVVRMALAEHLKRFKRVEVEIDDETDPRKPVRRTARLLFTTNMLLPVHRATWAHIWAPAARAADIPKGTGLHVLRHYFATLLIHKGASVKTVRWPWDTAHRRSRSTRTWGSGPRRRRGHVLLWTVPSAGCPGSPRRIDGGQV
jgi:hypothetical protein